MTEPQPDPKHLALEKLCKLGHHRWRKVSGRYTWKDGLTTAHSNVSCKCGATDVKVVPIPQVPITREQAIEAGHEIL